MFKGALYILSTESSGLVYSWKDALTLAPVAVKAQHSDKESVVELIKDVFFAHSATDSPSGTLHAKKAKASRELMALVDNRGQDGMEEDDDVIPEFERLESELIQLMKVISQRSQVNGVISAFF